MFLKYISIKIFIFSLCLGLLFAYLSTPEPTIIHVTDRAPSSTLRAMYDRGSLWTLGRKT